MASVMQIFLDIQDSGKVSASIIDDDIYIEVTENSISGAIDALAKKYEHETGNIFPDAFNLVPLV